MNTPLDNFNLNILEIMKLDDIFNYNSQQFVEGIDITGLLRAEIVFVVSALDHFIHSIIISESMNVLRCGKHHQKSFNKVTIGLDSVNVIINNHDQTDVLLIIENEIRTTLGWKSFQHPDKIAEALRIICDKRIWDEVSGIMGRPTSDLKEELKLIVKRRDSIVHEADFDLVHQCQYPINRDTTKKSVNFVISLVYAIDSIVFGYVYNQETVNQHLIT